MLDDRNESIRIDQPVNLICSLTAHFKGHLAKIGRSFEKESSGAVATSHGDIAGIDVIGFTAPILLWGLSK